MGKFDDLFSESDDDWIARSKKNIANLPKTKDTRTPAQKAEYEADRAESRRWAKEREAATKKAMDERVKNMSPEDKQFYRDRGRVSNPRGY